MLLIQKIGMQWTKKSRGAPGSKKRTSVPEGLCLPFKDLPEKDSCWIHRCGFYEHDDFQFHQTTERLVLQSALDLGPFNIVKSKPYVLVRLNNSQFGRVRVEVAPFELQIGLGQTLQWRIQGRVNGYEGAWYERHVVNIAWLERFDADVFRLRPFDIQHDDLPDLY